MRPGKYQIYLVAIQNYSATVSPPRRLLGDPFTGFFIVLFCSRLAAASPEVILSDALSGEVVAQLPAASACQDAQAQVDHLRHYPVYRCQFLDLEPCAVVVAVLGNLLFAWGD